MGRPGRDASRRVSAGWAERAASLRGLAVLAVPAALLGCVDVTKKDPDVCVGYTCAAGTECTVVHDPAPGNSSLTCELEPTIALSALSEGFAVSPLYLTPQTAADGAKIFTWDIPSGALSVQCTLFGCTPLFAYDRPSADQ